MGDPQGNFSRLSFSQKIDLCAIIEQLSSSRTIGHGSHLPLHVQKSPSISEGHVRWPQGGEQVAS